MHEHGAIISIGDELARGESLDTNSRWIAERLTGAGVRVVMHATLPDDLDAIARAFDRATHDADLVIATGGLGPTRDDLTRAALARALGEELIDDPDALREIESRYRARGRDMPAPNRVQALRPVSATCLPNANGTAPGLRTRLNDADVFCLPGPPREMRPMFEEHTAPVLSGPKDHTIRTRVIRTVGLPESVAAERLGGLMDRDRNPQIGTNADAGQVLIKLRYSGAPHNADTSLDSVEAQVRDALAPHVYATGDTPLAAAILELLRERDQTLSVVESCTGGLLGAALTAVPGSSDCFLGGWITYTNAMKHACVGVPPHHFPEHAGPDAPGAVSRETARAMAIGGLDARRDLDTDRTADWSLAITGVAGPSGGSPDKPVGTVWIALARRGSKPDARRFLFTGDRDAVRLWSVRSALAMLFLDLTGHPDTILASQVEISAG